MGGVDCVLIIHVLYVPFQNISVSSFSPDDRKWASEAMVESETAEVMTGATEVKTLVSGLSSLSRLTGWLVAPFVASFFISLLSCFCVPVFCFSYHI